MNAAKLCIRAASTLGWLWVFETCINMTDMCCLQCVVPCCKLRAAAGLPMAAQICTCPCRPLFYNWFWKYMSIVVTWHGLSNWILFGLYSLLDVVLACKWNLCHLSRPGFGIMNIISKTWPILVSYGPLESGTIACWIELAVVTMSGLLTNSWAVL